jgi:hypothetical protein
MHTPFVVHRAGPATCPTFGNGLGLLLLEQRHLRRADPRLFGTLSPYDSLRRRIQAAALA